MKVTELIEALNSIAERNPEAKVRLAKDSLGLLELIGHIEFTGHMPYVPIEYRNMVIIFPQPLYESMVNDLGKNSVTYEGESALDYATRRAG